MLEILLGIILAPVALISVVLSGCIVTGTIQAIFKRNK